MNELIYNSKPYPSELNLRLAQHNEMAQYDNLMAKHHKRGALRRIGHELHYVVEHQGQWIALISFSPAALKCTARDQWIGWLPQVQTDRLRLIANNSRFLILPGHHYPNLATRILSACQKRLSADWLAHFSKPLLLLETFVDSEFHAGTIYRADNWIMVGQTRGYKRVYGGYSDTPSESVKLVFLKPMHWNVRRILCALQLPDAYRYGVEKIKLKSRDYGSLYAHFRRIKDFRSTQGRRHQIASVLSLIGAAILSGVRSYKGIWTWCNDLSQDNLRYFRCRIVKGQRVTPSITCIRNVIMGVNQYRLKRLINAFCMEHFGLPFGEFLLSNDGYIPAKVQQSSYIGLAQDSTLIPSLSREYRS
ncbi:MAG: DUF4338 domain-containing protein [Aestuariivita sp.]|nr:DUF4338 domain-containing protein [Aestuariivita sp.]